MITLSEALSNFNGTTNYVAKYTPTGNVLGISQIFDNGTNVGIGTSTPTDKLEIRTNTNGQESISFYNINSGTNAIASYRIYNSLGTFAQLAISSNNFTGYGDWLSDEAILYSSKGLIISSDNNNDIKFAGNGSLTKMTIKGSTGNVGIGTTTPTSRLQIVGSDSTSSNYGLKVQNSGGKNSLVVRNDNQVMVNADNTPGDIRFYTKANGSFDYPLYVANSGSVGIFGVLGIGKIMANGGGDYDVGFQIGNQFNETMPFRVKNYNNQALFAVFENGFTSTNGRANFGSNAISLPNAIVQIVGSDSTSSNYSLKVDNSASSPLFYVRNDGLILANNLPTSASGLPSGAIWNNGGILNIV